MLRNRYLCGLEDVLDGLRDLRTNTVTLNQSNSVLAIRTLLTLELGNSLLCRAGVEADLFKRSKFSQLSVNSD
jgi:hypothetical protein